MKERINIRVSQKNYAIMQRINEMANTKDGAQQFTSTLVEILSLGLKAYDNGLREIDNQLINLKEKTPLTLSIEREVARSIFSDLCAAIAELAEYEESRATPNPEKINLYKLTRKALVNQKIHFPEFTTADVDDVFKTLAPILKQFNLSDSIADCENIFEINKQVFLDLVK